MSKKLKIKLKPFEVVVKELGYKPKKRDKVMYESKKCKTNINEKMLDFFGKEIEVHRGYETGLYGYLRWIINDMWVEKDPFKVSEINNLFNDLLKEV